MLDKIWKFFASLKPAGFIFTALILSTLIGSFIIQKPIAQEGQIERAYSPETVQIFEFFGFFDLFHSPWFVFLIFLLGVNVICASIEMWPRHVRLYKTVDPDLSEVALKNQPFTREFDLPAGESAESFCARLSEALKKYFKAPFITEKNGEARFFVNKMRLGYFGVYVVHAGLIIIMLGGIWGSIDGFEGQMGLMEGETSSKVFVKNALRKNKILDFQIKCHDISIDTYEDGSNKDYFSDLEVIDNGKSVLRQTIQVNEPLSYGGINFYQANYGKQKVNEEKFYSLKIIDAKTKAVRELKIPEEEKRFAVPGTNDFIEITNYHDNPSMPTDGGEMNLGPTLRFAYGNEAHQEFVTVFKDYPEVDAKLRPNASKHFAFVGLIEDFELREVTGLQVAYDPGAPVVFFGCAVLMIGICWTFWTSHQKVWAHVSGGRVLIAGRTYRNKLAFQTKFEKMIGELSQNPSAAGAGERSTQSHGLTTSVES